MNQTTLTIATRESPLAWKQAEIVKETLLKHNPEMTIELLGMTTKADQLLDIPLAEVGGKGLFVKELEEALLDGRADIAVHSMKDVPMNLPSGLCITAMLKREAPVDVFISNLYHTFDSLKKNAVIGTSSVRRMSQLKALNPEICCEPLRGNIQTRLRKLDEGQYDAIILAEAGLVRMDLESRIKAYFTLDQILPAAGQGALGIECREDDEAIKRLLMPLNDSDTFQCVSAERALCRDLDGGCKTPLAAFAEMIDGKIVLRALVANREGTEVIRGKNVGELSDAEALGLLVAKELKDKGAEAILSSYR